MTLWCKISEDEWRGDLPSLYFVAKRASDRWDVSLHDVEMEGLQISIVLFESLEAVFSGAGVWAEKLMTKWLRELSEPLEKTVELHPRHVHTCRDNAPGLHTDMAIMYPPEWMGLSRARISVDRCLVPVIQALWNAGIVTVNCCCGHGREPASVIVEVGAPAPVGLPSTSSLQYRRGYRRGRDGDRASELEAEYSSGYRFGRKEYLVAQCERALRGLANFEKPW